MEDDTADTSRPQDDGGCGETAATPSAHPEAAEREEAAAADNAGASESDEAKMSASSTRTEPPEAQAGATLTDWHTVGSNDEGKSAEADDEMGEGGDVEGRSGSAETTEDVDKLAAVTPATLEEEYRALKQQC